MSSFFIVSCARSGSTSLSKILNAGSNVICAIEPNPNLNIEHRKMIEGKLSNPKKILKDTVIYRVNNSLKNNRIYGEKNVTYGPFIPLLYEMINCKFVYIIRDGRDVVRSLMDWHERIFGSIYRECASPGNVSKRALSAAAKLPVHLDSSDYSRPRPQKGESIYNDWELLTREEMCAYYWSFINDLYLFNLNKVNKNSWIDIDYTSPSVDNINMICKFLGIKGIAKNKIKRMLKRKINSVEDRTGKKSQYPNWKNWDSGLRDKFDHIASKTMQKLGYYKNLYNNWRPLGYGRFWVEKNPDLNWYTWMFKAREKMHKDFANWLYQIESSGVEIKSVADFGCGLSVGYSELFSEKEFTGIDISEKNIQWCKTNRKNNKHEYISCDFITDTFLRKFDLVYSSGTIDNSYDIDAFFKSMVLHARKYIYLTCYIGWYPDIAEHIYNWNEEHCCFYNWVSPKRTFRILKDLGCKDIEIEPVITNNKDIPYETRIIAKVN